jgi:hypothetical protein
MLDRCGALAVAGKSKACSSGCTISGAWWYDGNITLNGVNPFEYLLAIATHPEAKLSPQAWMPWNYPKPAATSDSS